MTIKLLDSLGFNVGNPDVPEPLPCVIVWGNDFFVSNENDPSKRTADPRYFQVTGFVVVDTKEA